MPDPAPIEELPAIHEVDAVDNQLGSFMSDLDQLAYTVDRLAGGDSPPQEEVIRLVRAGLPLPEAPSVHFDPAAFARLLVFADELTRDAEAIKDDASDLRSSLLSLYRDEAIEKKAVSEGA
jgi:hypothetical protein